MTLDRRLPRRLVVCFALVLAGPAGLARAEDLSNFMVAALGGVGGSTDVSPGRSYGNPTFQLDLARITEPQTLVGIHLGRMSLNRKTSFGPLQNADLSYVDIGGEYRFSESYYESGIFLGIGAYRLHGRALDGASTSKTAVGGVLGLSGEFKINRAFGVLVELSGHYADLKDQKIFVMGLAGVSFHF